MTPEQVKAIREKVKSHGPQFTPDELTKVPKTSRRRTQIWTAMASIARLPCGWHSYQSGPSRATCPAEQSGTIYWQSKPGMGMEHHLPISAGLVAQRAGQVARATHSGRRRAPLCRRSPHGSAYPRFRTSSMAQRACSAINGSSSRLARSRAVQGPRHRPRCPAPRRHSGKKPRRFARAEWGSAVKSTFERRVIQGEQRQQIGRGEIGPRVFLHQTTLAREPVPKGQAARQSSQP